MPPPPPHPPRRRTADASAICKRSVRQHQLSAGKRWHEAGKGAGGNERGAPQINSPNTCVCVAHASISILLLAFLALLIDDKSGAAGMTATTRKKATKLRVSPTNTLTNTNNTNNTHTLARSRSLTLTENACVQRGNKKNNKKRQGGGRASEREAPGATDVIKEIIVTMSAAEASSEWRHTNTRAPQTDTRTRTSDGRFVSRFDKLKNQQFKVEVRWVWSNLP